MKSQKLYNEYRVEPKSINIDIIKIINLSNIKFINDENKIEYISTIKYSKKYCRDLIIIKYIYNIYKSQLYRKNIILNNDITVQLEASNRETAALLQENGGIIEGNETTLTVINETGSSKVYGIQTTGGTIQNLTIIGAGRAIYGLNCGDLTLKNVVIDGCTYSFNVMGEGKLYVENSTLYGWTSMNLSTGEFVRCTLGKGTSDYSTLKPYGSIIVKDSIFEEGYIIDARMLQEDGDKITLKNCKMGNTLITEDNIATIFPDAASSIVIDND